MERKAYDCDTYSYWCSEKDYYDRSKTFGRFMEDGTAYRIETESTPRPWLNYLCNDRFASVVSNTGLGFSWYKSSILRITKYEHPIDYLPRQFEDGREVIIEDTQTGKTTNVFRESKGIICTHRPGFSELEAAIGDLMVKMTLFVPLRDPVECMRITVKNNGKKPYSLKLHTGQTWSVARFGFHTAEEGIPYLSVPGHGMDISTKEDGVFAFTDNKALPFGIFTGFCSPHAISANVNTDVKKQKDGRTFRFSQLSLCFHAELEAGKTECFDVISYATEYQSEASGIENKYRQKEIFEKERSALKDNWNHLLSYPFCEIDEKPVQYFLNYWLKNQLYLTFRYGRSCYIGYRDTVQDTWGYTLLEPEKAKRQLLHALKHMKKDGSCPRSFSPFHIEDKQDLRNNMDSATWLAMCVSDYVKETGDVGILQEKIRYLDDPIEQTVLSHLTKAFDLLYEMRGYKGMCLTCDGDWNDALEGISKYGPAVSVWLTIALYHAQNILKDLYSYIGELKLAEVMKQRSDNLKQLVNENAWDGEWFIYAFSGKGTPIGSKRNKEGRIHLNVNTWAILTGIAESDKVDKIEQAIKTYLDTPIGPALLSPPYVEEGELVGRIAKLEPGTFENGSVYQHAAAFHIFAKLERGDYDGAYEALTKLLPTNPDNFDSRRTSEPYCTGNYYCGPTHPRFGQNFFTWFTGNPAWLLRAGFDEILGVKAGFEGLEIMPKVPRHWNRFTVKRRYRNTEFHLNFRRAVPEEETGIWINGKKSEQNILKPTNEKICEAEIVY